MHQFLCAVRNQEAGSVVTVERDNAPLLADIEAAIRDTTDSMAGDTPTWLPSQLGLLL
ncbi:MAG: hypothetical protein ACJ72A_11370 [Nocardioidaceae bacterium]